MPKMSNNSSQFAIGFTVLTGCLGTIALLTYQLLNERKKNEKLEVGYWSERRGRTRVEQEMRRLTEVQLNTSEGFFVQPIGVIDSCYRQCVGTPRQGALCPSSRASIALTPNMSPESLDGLEEFSHVWLTFKFHLNTNTLKEAKAFQGVTTDFNSSQAKAQGNQRFTFTGKVTPPMLKEKKGVLATRTPHRPNPFGVTLAKVERVDKRLRRLYLSACDLVQGTPILDIKPYVAAYDTVPTETYRFPFWIAETIDTRNVVSLAPGVSDTVRYLARSLKQYKNAPDEFLKGIIETLEADVRSKFQTKRRIQDNSSGIAVEVPFDDATVSFMWKAERELEIVDVVLTRKLGGDSISSTEVRALVSTDETLRLAEIYEDSKGGVIGPFKYPDSDSDADSSPGRKHLRPLRNSPSSPISFIGGEVFTEVEE